MHAYKTASLDINLRKLPAPAAPESAAPHPSQKLVVLMFLAPHFAHETVWMEGGGGGV